VPDRRRGQRRKSSKAGYPGWLYGVFGLALGLSVAAAIWFSDRRASPATPVDREPASMESALDDNNETVAPPGPAGPAEATAEDSEKKSRFDFYEMLPAFEVVVTEEEQAEVSRDQTPKAVVEPGIYVLQAGSFSNYSDADRRRAELALQGIESSIQKVTIDDKTYHRVRIGPIDDLDELNVLRSRLRAAKIDALRIRMGD
jgi:cell division protein FtsN